MNNWKDELKLAYTAPKPLRKKNFIQQFEPPAMSMHEFLFTQIGYISKWVWFISTLFFLITLFGTTVLSIDMLGIISAFTPLLALTLLTESERSKCFCMIEMEMATRFSLKSVVLARLGILGIFDLIILCLLVPLSCWNNSVDTVAVGLYIITPFMLTTFTGLHAARKSSGHESIYACVGIAIIISSSTLLSHNININIYHANNLKWWTLAALTLCIGIGKQYITIIKQTEELSWNLL